MGCCHSLNGEVYHISGFDHCCICQVHFPIRAAAAPFGQVLFHHIRVVCDHEVGALMPLLPAGLFPAGLLQAPILLVQSIGGWRLGAVIGVPALLFQKCGNGGI